MKYINIGKIVNTHGIKGEIRILSNFIYKDKVFNNITKIYIGKDKKEEEIISYRKHKMFDMICLKDINNINDVLKYKGSYVFINKEDLILEESEYLDEDLINLSVIYKGNEVGIVKKIERYNKNNLIKCQNKDKEFYIPYNFDIIDINIHEKKIYVKDIEGMIDDDIYR